MRSLFTVSFLFMLAIPSVNLALAQTTTPPPPITLTELDARLSKVEAALGQSPATPGLQKEVKTLRSLINTNNTQNQKSIENIKWASEKALDSTTQNVNASSSLITYLIALSGLFATLFTIGLSIFFSVQNKRLQKISDVAKQATEAADESKSNAEQTLDGYNKAQEKLDGHFDEMENLIKEVGFLQAFIDFKDNYNKLLNDGAHEDPQANERIVKMALKCLKKLALMKQDDEAKANCSHIHSMLGVLYFYQKRFKEAYDNFEIAKESNVHNRPDRMLNLACSALKMYEITQDNQFLNVTVENYHALSPYESTKKSFWNQQEVQDNLAVIQERIGTDNRMPE